MALKVLVSAYSCEPNRGSEPGIGWNWVCQLARFNEVWVITRNANREKIEAYLSNEPFREKMHFYYTDTTRLLWYRGPWILDYVQYLRAYFWQWACYRLAKELARERRFNAAIHIT